MVHNLLLPTAYLPPISWCAAFWHATKVEIETSEHYQKGSLRNRAQVAGPNGVQRLSIPLVKGKHQQTPIREVRISYEEAWQRQHWRTIQTAYGNAPYFEHYAEALLPFYTQRYAFLFDYNFALMEFVLIKKMGWGGEVNPTPGPSPFGEGGSTELRQGGVGALANTLLETDNNKFRHGAQDALAKWVALPSPNGEGPGVGLKYPQVFENKHGFLPNLSVLDLLFCCGKHGGEILEKSIIPT